MNDRILNDLRRCLMGILLLSCGVGLRAQCAGPFEMACQNQLDVALNDDCQALITPELALINLASCLVDSNFLIVVNDDDESNGPYGDGVGSFTYVVQGQFHSDLENFNCSGTINLVDASPPEIQIPPGPLDRGCDQRTQADINLLVDEVSRCWTIDGVTGLPVPGTFDGRLRQALLAGGGIPLVFDACGGDVQVCVNDAFDNGPATSCIDTVRLQRSFTARSIDGDPNFAPAFRAQNIRFIRPRISQLRGREETSFIQCADGPAPVNPLPRATDYPFFNGNTGQIHLNEGFCDFLVDFIDGERINGCGSSFAFVRTFRVRDWCASGADTSFAQLVQVGDYQGPEITPPSQDLDFNGEPDTGPLRFNTNTDQCAAVIDLLSGVTAVEACAPSFTLDAYIFLNGETSTSGLGPYRLEGGFTNHLSDPLPIGNHLLRYIGRDACGNTSVVEVNIQVDDALVPEAVCRESLTVRLNPAGFATLPASALDGGSSDDCGPIAGFSATLADETGSPLSPFTDQITFYCSEVGSPSVALLVRDEAGNESQCLMSVEVIDDRAPACIAPADVTLNCQDYAQELPLDLVAAFAGDPTGITALLDATFGTATTLDNCPETILSQTVTGSLNDCGAGIFQRLFTVTDAGGMVQQEVCQQVITVASYTDYTLLFPGDGNYVCGELPASETVTAATSGCDLLTVNVFQDTLDQAPAEACFALRLTYEVINWCEYNGLNQPLELSRDANDNGISGEAFFLHVLGNNPVDPSDDQAILDVDLFPNNGNELNQLTADYAASPQRGFFVYEQVIGVIDETTPVLTVSQPDFGLAFTEDCLGGVSLDFTITDNCRLAGITVTVDELVVDRNGDNLFTETDFAGEYNIPETRFEGEPTMGVTVPVRNLPIGQHLARIRTIDACDNVAEQYVLMQVVDGRPPEPLCRNLVTINLFPDPVTGGANAALTTDFIVGPATTCTPTDVTYALYTEEEAASPGFTPQAGTSSVAVTCADIGENVLRLYAFAENTGLSNFCNIALVVTDDFDLCADRNGSIEGLVHNEQGEPARDVEIITTGPVTLTTFTDGAGMFGYAGLEENQAYEVRPYLNRNALNGLSTADLNIIGRLLIGSDEGLSPYQLIAADANNNGSITILDLLMIREVILGVEDGFDNNASWRFVPADYVFPDPANPWAEPFPETAIIENLQGDAFTEFIAIKVGDVTGNANPQNNFSGSNPSEANARSAGVQLRLSKMKGQGIWGLYAPEAEGHQQGITAVQAALQLPPGAVIIRGNLTSDAYRIDQNNVLRISHVTEKDELDTAAPMLQIRLVDDQLPVLVRSQNDLPPEAYTADFQVLPLELVSGDAFTVAPVGITAVPNPFSRHTNLSFSWPVNESVSLVVHDVAGREVFRNTVAAVAGANNFRLDSGALKNAHGLFLVRLNGEQGEEQVLRLIRK